MSQLPNDNGKLAKSTLKVRASKKLQEEINKELAEAAKASRELTLEELEEFATADKKGK